MGKRSGTGVARSVVVLGVASFFTDVSSEMLYPIVPVFLTTVIGAPIQVLGLIEGIAESTASILKGLSGWYSDRVGKRKPLVAFGYGLSSLSKPLMYLAYAWPMVLVSRVLDRLGKGIRTSPRDAMIADATTPGNRGRSFGFHRAMDGLGACLGPLLALWCLSAMKDNLRIVFLIAFIPALIAVAILFFLLKETAACAAPPCAVKTRMPFTVKTLPPQFMAFLGLSSIFAIGNSSDAFLIMRAKDIGLSMAAVIGAYVLYNVSRTVTATSIGSLSDRIPRKYILAGGYGVFALVYAGFGFIHSGISVWIFFAVYGLYMAMTDGVGKALAADMVGAEYRGTALGLYHLTLGIFTFLASFIAGLLWAHLGAPAPFIFGAVMALISGAAILAFVR